MVKHYITLSKKNSLWTQLWTCHKVDYMTTMIMMMI